MNIASHFFEQASKNPNNIAIVHKGKTVTFGKLQEMVFQKASALRKKGIKRGDNLMLMVPFSIELYVNILAVFTIGGRVVLVDAIKDKEMVYKAFQKSECKGIITIKFIYFLRHFLFSMKLWSKFIRLSKLTKSNITELTDINARDTALISFTTGSTGMPKAADRTHQFLDVQLGTLMEEMQLNVGDIHITSLPVVLMCNLATGATSIIPPKTKNAHQKYWNYVVEHHSPNVVSASPKHFENFIQFIDPNKVDKVFIGGSTILPHFAKNLSKQVDPRKVEFVYGSTEAEPMAVLECAEYLDSISNNEAGVCVGRSHANIHLIVASENDGRLEPKTEGEIGEILVSGPHVLDKYYKDEASFKKNKIEFNGKLFHRTGDAGYLKGDLLYYCGRMKYLWTKEGKPQSPTFIERQASLLEKPLVLTALKKNDAIYIFAEQSTQEEVQAFCNSIDIADAKIILKDKLPRDLRHLSRIDYEQLKRSVA
jgi:acyl-coenzyme A synthetase/AMP-(fatty) acid ligase